MTPLGAQGPYPLSASSEWQLKLPKNACRFFGSIFLQPDKGRQSIKRSTALRPERADGAAPLKRWAGPILCRIKGSPHVL